MFPSILDGLRFQKNKKNTSLVAKADEKLGTITQY
jgi:hypothetical protein